MTKWTTEQQQAISCRGKSILVSAAAGSGKTAVLVERIIQRICDTEHPSDIDRLLVVTFTNAAATEMKERVGIAIQKALQDNPFSEHLYRQSLLLRDAKITTVHSFCLDFVRENFFALGIDPDIRIADETERMLLLQETMDELMESHYGEVSVSKRNWEQGENAHGNGEYAEDEKMDADRQTAEAAAFCALVDAYGGKADEALREQIIGIFQKAESMPNPAKWMEQLGTEQEPDWFALAGPAIRERVVVIRRSLMKAIQLASLEEGLKAYLPLLETEYNSVTSLLDVDTGKDWPLLETMVAGVEFARLPNVKKGTVDEDIKAKVQQYRKDAKEALGKLQKEYFSRTYNQQQTELEQLAVIRRSIAFLALELAERFRVKKLEKNMMDFSDMEHFCYSLLYTVDADGNSVPSDLALQVADWYEEVMVDEYQDINNLQEAILHAVSRPDNLFMVGDVKQSIYGFRNANPDLFQQKYEDFATESPEHVRICLNRNFRCRQGVVNGVNDLFARIMNGKDGELRYDANAALIYGAGYPERGPEWPQQEDIVHWITVEKSTAEDVAHEKDASNGNSADFDRYADEFSEGMSDNENGKKSTDGDEELTGENRSDAEKEAILIGKTILQHLENRTPVFDKEMNDYRAATWRDAVILLRSPKSVGRVYADVLKSMGIPVALDIGDGYFSAWEIEMMLAVLQVVDNPQQDIPLMAVLKAPFIGFSDEEVAEIRMFDRTGNLYESLVAFSEADRNAGEGLPVKVQSFLDWLGNRRMLSHQIGLSDFLLTVYRETGFYEFVGTLPQGVQRQANLRALADRARGYEATSYHGVFAFLHFLKQLQDSKKDLEPARVLSDSENVVRIMSIHKSKGQEFPIVYVGSLGRGFNNQDSMKDFQLDDMLGLAISYVNVETESKYRTIAQKVILSVQKRMAIQEEKRILYVAMTRAREYLYLVGTCSDMIKRQEKMQEKHVSSAGCYLDWLLGSDLKKTYWDTTVIESDSIFCEEEGHDTANLLWTVALAGTSVSDLPEEEGAPEKASNSMQEDVGDGLSDENARDEDTATQRKKMVEERLNWHYADDTFTTVKGLYSVSELTKRKPGITFGNGSEGKAMQQNEAMQKNGEASKWTSGSKNRFETMPLCMIKDSNLTGAQKGTAIHEVLQHMDLQGEVSEDAVAMQIQNMVDRYLLLPEQARAVDMTMVTGFLKSEIGMRLRQANPADVYRELPFMYALDSHRINEAFPAGAEQVLVQGIADCLWRESGGWVLVDYKSDRVSADEAVTEINNRYSRQIALYREALSAILGEPVKEAYFYLLSLNMVIPAKI